MTGSGSIDGPEWRDGTFGRLEPALVHGQFVFVELDPEASREPERSEILASIREPEGLSLVVARKVADRLSLEYEFVAAWITLGVDSSLEAIGLTAMVSSALARAGIACNVIAGLRHDHLFVPADRVEEALAILRAPFGEAPAPGEVDS